MKIDNQLSFCIASAAIFDVPFCDTSKCDKIRDFEHARNYRHPDYEKLGVVQQLVQLARSENTEKCIAQLFNSTPNESSDREQLSKKIEKAMQYSFDEKQFSEFSSQRDKLLKQLSQVQRRKLRIAFLA